MENATKHMKRNTWRNCTLNSLSKFVRWPFSAFYKQNWGKINIYKVVRMQFKENILELQRGLSTLIGAVGGCPRVDLTGVLKIVC